VAPVQHERRLDRITAPAYLDGLAERGDDELHAMKAEAEEVETEISYVRRLAQGRIEIVEAQRANRQRGRGGIEDLVAELPNILAKDLRASPSPATARIQKNLAPDPKVEFTRELEPLIGDSSLVRLPEMDDAELDDVLAKLRELVETASSRRSALHRVIDTIDAEIGRRAAAAS
jgi:hypothetical protein